MLFRQQGSDLNASLLLISGLACIQSVASDSRVQARAPFTEIGAQALPGIGTRCGTPDKNFIIEVNGGGVLLGDFDGDGSVDVVIVDGSTIERVEKEEPGFPPRLFLGKGDGTFAPAGSPWAMAGGRWGMGGAVGDLNSDGWPDLVITEWGPDRVFLNDGGKGFTEITSKAGLTGERWGTSAALLDYDKDGKLDLVVVNYLDFDPRTIGRPPDGQCRWKGHDVMCGPEGLTPIHDQLYHGNGDGTFKDVTIEAHFRPGEAAFGLGVMTLDYDGDGDTDVYVTNDSMPNHLWENQGDGTFKEVGFRRGVSHDSNGKEQASMGIACADWNRDGRDDLFITNFSGESNALYVSTKGAGFRERSSPTGLAGASIRFLGWGTGFSDFDLDGDLDLFVLNGHVYPQADLPGTDTSYAQPDHLFRNDGQGRFSVERLSDAPAAVSRAGAMADIDNDGDIDIVGLAVDGQVRVFLNNAARGPKNHWLEVALRSKTGNRFGLGARITARWQGGEETEEIRTAGGFQAAVPAQAHYGLGPADRLESLTVHWLSGRVQVLERVAVDRRLIVSEDAP